MIVKAITGAAVATFLFTGIAVAQTGAAGDTSGAASGKNVNPSTAVQKDTGRSEGGKMAPSATGGAPGVEGAAGSKNGPAARSPNSKQ
jgi:hypothetical protein